MLLKFYWYHFGCCVANTMSESRGPSRETNQEAIEIIQFGVGPVAVGKAKSGQDLDNLKEIIIFKKITYILAQVKFNHLEITLEEMEVTILDSPTLTRNLVRWILKDLPSLH